MSRIERIGTYLPVFLLLATVVFVSGFSASDPAQGPESWYDRTPLAEVLQFLGDPPPEHQIAVREEQAKRGEEIVKNGFTTGPDGKQSSYVSKYYVCTTCHNLEQEDPDLRVSDPGARLAYVKEKGIPFLQGTTFKGIVNRESWYNDDYVKKYGDEMIGRAHHSLRESIQLCAVQCSQGRPMEKWEIESVLAYFWKLQFQMGDLELGPEQWDFLRSGSRDPEQFGATLSWLKEQYLQKSPAHFYDAPASKVEGYPGLTGDPARGKDLYELSCLHCHKPEGVSHYILDDSRLSFAHLRKMIPKDSHFSLYQIIPYGTYAIPGHRPYMPHYPLERMSKQQVEDLRAYVELRTN